ncbi:citrinin biosynthesis oxydoreductase [Colletotrichum incanum]|uniref:Citrinin biosynthesis oxydoreductase n=1 Tax=Colletotrichum incanum TaxID=1573173 RepID=A0A161VSA4_COLIC|nr:citrinin biosynthesis oxydoreductase [Colletotrichum incanum]
MKSNSDPTLALPRILCLHGGGTNAAIFRAQCRGLIRALTPHFRLVFADGPFVCNPHPDIVATYGSYGPFRRWLPWHRSDECIDRDNTVRLIRRQISKAIDIDDFIGGIGEWVGLLGFSQGANISASLLWTQQALSDESILGRSNWRFGIIVAGRPPLIALDHRVDLPPGIAHAAAIGSEFEDWPDESNVDHVLRLPTLHIHGTMDPGLEHHRRLLNVYCDSKTTRLVEWDGAHRMPLKKSDIDIITQAILELGQDLAVNK